MDVIWEDEIIQMLNPTVRNRFIISNLAQIDNTLHVDNTEKKKLKAGTHSFADAVCCVSMVSTEGWKSKPNYQFINKFQYLLTKNRISILSKRNLKNERN